MRLVSLVAATLAAGCVAEPDALDTTTADPQAISGGRNDPHNLDTDVVVRVGLTTCGGTLLTPRIVLTAYHCISDELGRVASTLSVQIEPTLVDHIARPIPMMSGLFEGWRDAGQDVALLVLDTPALTHARIRRPSLSSPVPTDGDDHYTPPMQIAGFSSIDSPFRQVATLSSVDSVPTFTGMVWMFWMDPVEIHEGDSGGPMFVTRADGSRDVVGVASVTGDVVVEDYAMYADITRGAARQFVLANVVDQTRTSRWLARHNRADLWIGEVDYTGPVDRRRDRDGDHWFDETDNCPAVANIDQVDSNNDGNGDTCPFCPCDPDNDVDGDRVCAQTCRDRPLDAVDNCPRITNPDQANCNLESELMGHDGGLEIWGDACDPVPCPRTDADQVTGRSEICSPFTAFLERCRGREIHDQLHTLKIASHVAEESKLPQLPRAVDVDFVPTATRFCQRNLSDGWQCAGPGLIRDSALYDFPDAASEYSDRSRPWHRVTIDGFGRRERGHDGIFSYNDRPVDETWDYQADWEFWNRTWPPVVPWPDPSYAECWQSPIPGTCLDGRLWMHADTPVGFTKARVGNVHVGIHGWQLANHYLDVRPDLAYVWQVRRVKFWSFPAGWYLPPGYRRFLADHTSVLRPHVVFDPESGELLALDDDGTQIVATELIDVALLDSLHLSDRRWAGAIDAPGTGGPIGEDVLAVAVAGDGSHLVDAVVARDGRMTSAVQAGLLHAPLAHAPPRTDYTVVFARAAGAAFVLGGFDASGEPARDVWALDLAGGVNRIPTWEPIGHVVDATYVAAEDALWILAREGRRVRLLRLARDGGGLDVLATASDDGWAREAQITADERGGVYLVVGAGATARVARLEVGIDGQVSVGDVVELDGVPVGEPAVASDGLDVVLQRGEQGLFPTVVELRSGAGKPFDDLL